jgi:putative spermidine/putrescine transport system ATP-binding protein
LSAEGQEIRAARAITEARDGGIVTLALRPESIELGEGGGSNRLKGTVEDVSFLGSIVRTRVRLGDSDMTVSLDTFNDPNLSPPAIDEVVTLSFPPESSLVVGAGPAPEIDVVAGE